MKNFRKKGTTPGITNEPYFSPYTIIQLSNISQLPQDWPLPSSRVFKQGCNLVLLLRHLRHLCQLMKPKIPLPLIFTMCSLGKANILSKILINESGHLLNATRLNIPIK